MTFEYDLFVIGGGSGGVRSARVAAGDTGAKVGLAEQSRYGGTCVIRGCVPKKLMVFASEFSVMTEQARAYGWPVERGPFNWGSFQTKLNAELDRLEGVYRSILAKAGVETFDMAAKLVEPHVVELADGTRKTAKHILLAVGGRPVKPDIPGADLAITSKELFNLHQRHERVHLVGEQLVQRVRVIPQRYPQRRLERRDVDLGVDVDHVLALRVYLHEHLLPAHLLHDLAHVAARLLQQPQLLPQTAPPRAARRLHRRVRHLLRDGRRG